MKKTERGSGRTQWMIDQLCDAVLNGQPKCVVVAHTMDFALQELMPRVIAGLERRGLKVSRISREWIEANGSEIALTSTCLATEFHRRRRGFREFIDHYACGEM